MIETITHLIHSLDPWILIPFFVLVLIYGTHKFRGSNNELNHFKIKLTNLKKFLNDNDSDPEIKTKIDEYLKSQKHDNNDIDLLELAWQEFSEGMLEYDGTWRNAHQAEDFFTREALIEPQIKKIEHVPGIFSALGLLFTFIALAWGLLHLDYQDLSKTINGLDSFINALGSKFITSIFGLSLALIIDGIWVRPFNKEFEKGLNKIVFLLNKNFKRMTTQEMLKIMNKSVSEIPGEISKFFESNSGTSQVLLNLEHAISEGVKKAVEGIQGEIHLVAESMKDFSAAGLSGMAEQLKTIGQDMREGLTQGLSSDLAALKSTMERLPEIISETLSKMELSTAQMKLSIADSQKEMSNLITKIFEEIQEKQGNSVNELIEQMVTKNIEINQKLAEQQELMQRKQEEGINKITEKLLENSQHSSVFLQSLLDEIKSNFENSSTEFRAKLETQQTHMQEIIMSLMENLGRETSGLTENLQKSTQGLQADYSDFALKSQKLQEEQITSLQSGFENSYKQIVESQADFKNHVQDVLNSNKEYFIPILNELKQNVVKLSEQTSNLPIELGRSGNKLLEATSKIEFLLDNQIAEHLRTQTKLNEDQSQALIELGSYLSRVTELHNESKNIQTMMEKLVELYQNIASIDKEKDQTLRAQIEMLRQAMQEQQSSSMRLMDEYKETNKLIDMLTHNFAEIGPSLSTSIEKIKEASTGYFNDFSKHHNSAIESLKRLVDDIGDSISERQFSVK